MSSLVEPSAFVHDPLPDSTTHIRLLEILHAGPTQQIACSVSEWPLNDVPSYCAVSYTWGDPTDLTAITLNGQTMAVGRNCQYAMLQVFALKTDHVRYIWLDAVCIDQTSTQEKNIKLL